MYATNATGPAAFTEAGGLFAKASCRRRLTHEPDPAAMPPGPAPLGHLGHALRSDRRRGVRFERPDVPIAAGSLHHLLARSAETGLSQPGKQEDDMMNWNDMGAGMGWGMGFGWLFGLLILVLLVLAIAALIKYLRK